MKLPATLEAAGGQSGWSRNLTPMADQNPESTGDSGRRAPECEAENRTPHPAPRTPDKPSGSGLPQDCHRADPEVPLTLVMTRGSPCSRPPFRVKPQGAPPLSCTSTRRSPSAARVSASTRRSGRARGSAPSMTPGAQPLQPLRPTPMHSGKHKWAHNRGASRRPGHRRHRRHRHHSRHRCGRPPLNLLCNLESAARAGPGGSAENGAGRGTGRGRSRRVPLKHGKGRGGAGARLRAGTGGGAHTGVRTDCATGPKGVSLVHTADRGLGARSRTSETCPNWKQSGMRSHGPSHPAQ